MDDGTGLPDDIKLLAPVGTLDILPGSAARVSKNLKFSNGMFWVPIFCANCGADGGMVPEETKDVAFYLCDSNQNDCAARYGPIAGTMPIPDEVFWAAVRAECLAQKGRDFTAEEVILAINDETNPLAKLARERYSRAEYNRRH